MGALDIIWILIGLGIIGLIFRYVWYYLNKHY